MVPCVAVRLTAAYGISLLPITSAVEVGGSLGQPYAALRPAILHPNQAGLPRAGRLLTAQVIDRDYDPGR